MNLPIVPGSFRTLADVASYLNKLATAIASGWYRQHYPDGTHGEVTLKALNFDSSQAQLTVGAGGAASAIPGAPTGYVKVSIGGTVRVVPFFDAS